MEEGNQLDEQFKSYLNKHSALNKSLFTDLECTMLKIKLKQTKSILAKKGEIHFEQFNPARNIIFL